MRHLRPLFPALALLAASAPAAAQSITVDLALDDFMDFGGGQTVADLPGPDGHVTLREAVTAANNTPGPQTIEFAIPVSEWSIFADDRAMIALDDIVFVRDNGTFLDFATQTAFTGDTNPSGNEVGLMYWGPPAGIPCLYVTADQCAVRGLDVTIGNNSGNGIWISGNYNTLVGCTTSGLRILGDHVTGGSFNRIGGSNPGEGNTFSSTVDILSNADDNVLLGNSFRWGLRIIGDTYYGTCDRTRLGGPTAAERNFLAGRGYWGVEGYPTGTQLQVHHATDTLIEGNFVGTTNDGLAKYPGHSGWGGIEIGTGAVRTTVRDNLVSGFVMIGADHYSGVRVGTALAVQASAANTVLTGNRIGLAADGLSPIPSVEGIVVTSDPNGTPLNVLIGGNAFADANSVAFHETAGVSVRGEATGVRISGNSIHDNGALGIDLLGLVGSGGGGVTPNDPLDADVGGNGLQNFPVLTAALSMRLAGTSLQLTKVSGRLRSAANGAYLVEFFANAAADASGHGEGAQSLGTLTVLTDAQGNARFSASLVSLGLAGPLISATATDAAGSTSEFSVCVAAGKPGLQAPQ